MEGGLNLQKLEFNHKREQRDEEGEGGRSAENRDLFVQFDIKYENFRSRGGSSRAQEDATGIVFGP